MTGASQTGKPENRDKRAEFAGTKGEVLLKFRLDTLRTGEAASANATAQQDCFASNWWGCTRWPQMQLQPLGNEWLHSSFRVPVPALPLKGR